MPLHSRTLPVEWLSITKRVPPPTQARTSPLTVLAFDDMDGAERMRETMYDFQRRELITLERLSKRPMHSAESAFPVVE